MSLWDWAVAAYAQPGVEDACLTLQDEHGQNVPFLLWAAWGGTGFEQGAELARAWERSVVGPLRGVRRAMTSPPLIDEPLREEVKAVELKAERRLLEALEKLGGRKEGDVLQSLTAASAAWSPPAPPDALRRLADALSGI